MKRRLHPNKDIEAALSYAECQGWRVQPGGSHCWGKMYCPWNDKACRCGEFCISCISCIWSTPRSAYNHARQIRLVVDNCSQQSTPAIIRH
ncbi:hypothetical protein EC843_103466 [Buttiauxella sp. JUb87]|uniref:hypothetical protein n=1 Tax=Buttiauxella sp. JUb87 TaxID=2485129 RepID=UPI00105C1F0D|nr:hypothetical protein [Buttiauxella sp. JUb87]TDN52035.1 hypothetical protein EC843_103466 [Buttiauxella sp. JUb87]